MKRIIKIANLLFYIVIFIVFIYFVFQINSKKNIKNTDKQKTEIKEEKKQNNELKEFDNKNFKFEYILEIDGIKTTYLGENNKNRTHFIYKSSKEESEYYSIEDVFLKHNNKNYILSTNPSLYFDFFDIEKIKTIILKLNNNSISNKDLYYIEKSELLGDNRLNKVDIIKENNIIKQVKIDLTNFANLYKSNSKVTLILNYSDYNKINEININK
jgi:hypothetical protein